MVTTEPKLDYILVRALREGPAALPGDIRTLGECLAMIGALLEEKATELEPSWDESCAALAEIETLQALETAVAERAIALTADSIEAVRGKLAIWQALGPEADECAESPRTRLIRSVQADLERMCRATAG
jgi:hypothetical protein